jgi:hypothetical protein
LFVQGEKDLFSWRKYLLCERTVLESNIVEGVFLLVILWNKLIKIEVVFIKQRGGYLQIGKAFSGK